MSLSYQHAYHVGGPADIVKHTMLGLLLARLTEKPGPITYLETHAARGRYSLAAPETQKIAEYQSGLSKLWPVRHNAPSPLNPFLNVLEELNQPEAPTTYPGSPQIAASILREQDTLHLAEAHPQEHAALTQTFAGQTNVHIYKTDGHAKIPQLIQANQRPLVLIDPSYEVKTEYAQVAETVKAILKTNPKTIIMVWYPLIDERHNEMMKLLNALNQPATWRAELSWNKPGAKSGAHGTGQIILNLPYELDADMDTALEWLAGPLANPLGAWRSGYIHGPR